MREGRAALGTGLKEFATRGESSRHRRQHLPRRPQGARLTCPRETQVNWSSDAVSAGKLRANRLRFYFPAGGATDNPLTPLFSIHWATRPDALTSSTKSRR